MVAVRQFSQEERSRARSELSRQSTQTVRLIEEFAEKRLSGEAGAPADFASSLGAITAAHVYFVGRSGLEPPIDEVRFGKAPKGTEARLDWKLLGDEGEGADARPEARRRHLDARRGQRVPLRRPADRRDRRRPPGALDQRLDARAGSPRRAAAAAGRGRRRALVALLLSRRITRPVRELTEASERIALGDYDVHLTSKGPDELGQLALRFEQMARQLQEASEHERNFLMRISHELRTPLTAIQGHVQAIADGVIEGEEEQQASLEIVLAEAGRLQRLIGDLLDLARLESRKFSLNVEEVEPARRVRASGRARSARRPARARSSCRCWRAGDAGRARRRRPHPADRLQPRHERPPRDARRTARSRSTWRSARAWGRSIVSDTGPGIPEAERASILRPFVTSDVRHGIGLGLPVASELAHAMGGTLVVGERPGGGAAFTLSLPLAGGSGAAPRAGAERFRRAAEPASELVAE